MKNNSEETLLNLYGVVTDSIVDGPGLRLAIFFQGCPHHCLGCHNEQSQKFVESHRETVGKILDKITPLTCGITISGGEPFSQPDELLALVVAARNRDVKNIWVWSGWTFEQLIEGKAVPRAKEILQYIDVLVDGRYVKEKHSSEKLWVGSSNQRIIDVPESLSYGEVKEIMLPE